MFSNHGEGGGVGARIGLITGSCNNVTDVLGP